ncbi:DUF421 domain-containing protein [Paenibacillus sp. MER TA 81-3]|uniref:DUF421 domain-containing protein n=1 Tax=Paenibacillus sp. MER TA 81-3 TaxID=2939573 RepID=UPI00203C10D7|nr:DUF421 domain-containing protein [Paenibacillus sp. MER TA 81-3]MCM3339457.1 DUF421 domain-containing protein [Paenibacillus sp. MER TA 81-3]
MEIWTVVVRTVVMYFTVFIVLRLMGKREIGKLSVFDLVISIMIADVAVFVIEDKNRPYWEGFVPIGVLIIIQISLSFMSLKSRRLRLLFDGFPSIVIANGNLNRKEMSKQRYNLDDLMQQLREQGIDNFEDVKYAILESTGKLTVFLTENASSSNGQSSGADDSDYLDIMGMSSGSSTSGDDSSEASAANASSNTKQKKKPTLPQPDRFRFATLPLPLIMDGKVQDDNLQSINKTRFWLKNQLQLKGVNEFKQVFFCSIDHKGHMFIDRKQP